MQVYATTRFFVSSATACCASSCIRRGKLSKPSQSHDTPPTSKLQPKMHEGGSIHINFRSICLVFFPVLVGYGHKQKQKKSPTNIPLRQTPNPRSHPLKTDSQTSNTLLAALPNPLPESYLHALKPLFHCIPERLRVMTG